jgi:hypothetical protein
MKARVLQSTRRRRRMSIMRLGCLSLVVHYLLHCLRNRYFKQLFAIYVTNLKIVTNDAYIVIAGH